MRVKGNLHLYTFENFSVDNHFFGRMFITLLFIGNNGEKTVMKRELLKMDLWILYQVFNIQKWLFQRFLVKISKERSSGAP